MPARVAAILAVQTATPLSADIAWQAARIAPGSLMVMGDERGEGLSHVARGRTAGAFRFDTYEGKGDAPVYAGSYNTNDRGEEVRSVSADGGIMRYEPHRCARTLGACSYVIVRSDGCRETRKRVTRETAPGLAWKDWGLDGLVATGAPELDRFGAAKTGWRKGHAGGAKTRSRRLMPALR